MPTPRTAAGTLPPVVGAGVVLGVACGVASGVGGGFVGVGLMTAHDLWDLPPAAQNLTDAVVGVSYSLIAAVMLLAGRLTRGSRMLAGVLLVAGAASGLTAWATAVAMGATSATGLVKAAVQLQSFLWVPGFLPLLTLVPLLYPSGLLPGRVWRLVAAASVVGIALLTIGVGLFPEPFEGRIEIARPISLEPVARVAAPAGGMVLLGCVVAALASLVVRLRRTRGLERRQVVVLLVAAALLALVTALQGAIGSPVDVLVQAAAAALVPLAIGIAVTRHRLYDLDTAVCRALALASLAVCLAGLYLTVFALLQGLPGHESGVSAAVAAGLSGALVQPLGRRLARGVDRLYYGHRAEPYAVTTRMSAALSEVGLDVDRVPDTVCRTVVEALRLPHASLVLGSSELASAGSAGGPTESFDLVHHGDVVAELVVAARAGERELPDSDRAVLQQIAAQVAPALAALRLHHELQRSRELLVSAREAERRQLRRDLHDGLGASLAGLRLQLETAAELVEQPAAAALLSRADETVTQAVAEIRSLVDGLRPAGIDELGLARSLHALAERSRAPALDVRVAIPPELALPPAVEVAVHRIVAEALANAAKHSGASTVHLCVTTGDRVEVLVADDGHGIRADAPTSGSGLGLDSMRLRAEEIGGRLLVESDENGTRVCARLPTSVGGVL